MSGLSPWNKFSVTREQTDETLACIPGILPSNGWNLLMPPVTAISLPTSPYAWRPIIHKPTLTEIENEFKKLYPEDDFEKYLNFCNERKIYTIGEGDSVKVEDVFESDGPGSMQMYTKTFEREITMDDVKNSFEKYNSLPNTIPSKECEWTNGKTPEYVRIIEAPYVEFNEKDNIKIHVNRVLDKNMIYRFNTFIHIHMPSKMIALVIPKTLPANVYGIDRDDIGHVAVYAFGQGEFVEFLEYELIFLATLRFPLMHWKSENTSIILPQTGLSDQHKVLQKIKVPQHKLLKCKDGEDHIMGISTSFNKNIIILPRKRLSCNGIYSGISAFNNKKVVKSAMISKGIPNTSPFNVVCVGGRVIPKGKILKQKRIDTMVSKKGLNSHMFDEDYLKHVKIVRAKEKSEALSKRIEELRSENNPSIERISKLEKRLDSIGEHVKMALELDAIKSFDMETVDFEGCYDTMKPIYYKNVMDVNKN